MDETGHGLDVYISIHALREEGDAESVYLFDRALISIHALREEGDNRMLTPGMVSELFLSTPSARRATLFSQLFTRIRKISIHALREEGDLLLGFAFSQLTISIHALREEGDAVSGWRLPHHGQFLSTPSARRATAHPCAFRDSSRISIHALREEGDLQFSQHLNKPAFISIHALREEGDLPVGGRSGRGHRNFYPRPPRGGRPARRARPTRQLRISIHALREEGDTMDTTATVAAISDFYPRPPRGGRPARRARPTRQLRISIHALREEGDTMDTTATVAAISDFYPRPPRGGRHHPVWPCRHYRRISIHALREEGDGLFLIGCVFALVISIHALREEGDSQRLRATTISLPFLSTPSARRATANGWIVGKTKIFLSTPSARRATGPSAGVLCTAGISIHALREEGDHISVHQNSLHFISIHALREEGDVAEELDGLIALIFLSTPSARRATLPF